MTRATTTAARCYRAAVSPDLLTPGVIVNQTDPTALWQHLVQWQPATAAALAQHIRTLPDDWPLRVFGVGRPDAALALPPGAAGEQFPNRAPEIAPYNENASLEDCPACIAVEGTCRFHEGCAVGYHTAVQAQHDAVRVNPGMGLREFVGWQADVEEAESLGEEPPRMPAAVSAVVSPPTDHAALVPRAVRPLDIEHDELMERAAAEHQARTTAETARKAADRAATLLDAADHFDRMGRTVLAASQVRDLLRRLAVEAQTCRWEHPHPGYQCEPRTSVEAHGTETQQPARDCPACDAGIAHTVHCPTPESHNWGCGCPTDAPAPVAEQPAAATGYGDGKGRVYCPGCASKVGADVPLTADDVDHWELCPRCGRHVIDVARTTEQQPAAADDEETLGGCGHGPERHGPESGCVECRCPSATGHS